MKKFSKKSKRPNLVKKDQVNIPNDNYISLMKNKKYKEDHNYIDLSNKMKINYYGDNDTEDNDSIDGTETKFMNYLTSKYDVPMLLGNDYKNIKSINSKEKMKDFDFLNSITDLQYKEYKNIINNDLNFRDSMPYSPYLETMADVYESNMSEIETESPTFRPQIEDRLGYLNTPVPPTPIIPSINYINYENTLAERESNDNIIPKNLCLHMVKANNNASDQSTLVFKSSKNFLEKRNFKNMEGDIGNLWMEMKQLKNDLLELKNEGFIDEDGDDLCTVFDEDKLMQQTFLLQCLKKSFDQLLREHHELGTKLDVLSSLPLTYKNKGIQKPSKINDNLTTGNVVNVKNKICSGKTNNFDVCYNYSKVNNSFFKPSYNNNEMLSVDSNSNIDNSNSICYNSSNKDFGMQYIDSDFPENESDIYDVTTHFYNNYLHDVNIPKYDIHRNISKENNDNSKTKFSDRWLDEVKDFWLDKEVQNDTIISQIKKSASVFISSNRAHPQFIADMLGLLTQISDTSMWKNIIGAVNHVIGSSIETDKLDEMSNCDMTESIMDINDIEKLSLASLNASEVNSVAGFSDDEDYGEIHLSETYNFEQAGYNLGNNRFNFFPNERQKTFIIETATEPKQDEVLKSPDSTINQNNAGDITSKNLSVNTMSQENLVNSLNNLQSPKSLLEATYTKDSFTNTNNKSNLNDVNIEYEPINERLDFVYNAKKDRMELNFQLDPHFKNSDVQTNEFSCIKREVDLDIQVDKDLKMQQTLHLKMDKNTHNTKHNGTLHLPDDKLDVNITERTIPDNVSVFSFNYSSDFESETDKSSGHQSDKSAEKMIEVKDSDFVTIEFVDRSIGNGTNTNGSESSWDKVSDASLEKNFDLNSKEKYHLGKIYNSTENLQAEIIFCKNQYEFLGPNIDLEPSITVNEACDENYNINKIEDDTTKYVPTTNDLSDLKDLESLNMISQSCRKPSVDLFHCQKVSENLDISVEIPENIPEDISNQNSEASDTRDF